MDCYFFWQLPADRETTVAMRIAKFTSPAST